MNAKRGALILSMLIFGTIGVLRRHIGLSSGALAMLRGCIGAVCLAVFVLLGRKNMDFSAVRRNLAKLLLSGACIRA